MLVYILVDNAAATADKVIGEIVQPIGADAPEMTARFRNPAGSVLGFCQQPRDLPSVVKDRAPPFGILLSLSASGPSAQLLAGYPLLEFRRRRLNCP